MKVPFVYPLRLLLVLTHAIWQQRPESDEEVSKGEEEVVEEVEEVLTVATKDKSRGNRC